MGSQNPAWYFAFLKGKKEEVEEDGGGGGGGVSEHNESGFRGGHHGTHL